MAKYWIKNYFFTKVSDNLLAFIFLIFVMVILFKSKPENKINFKFENVKIFYLFCFFTISFWFVKHPTLRYGGYCILLILFSVPTSIFLSKKSKINFNLNKRIKYLLFLLIYIFLTNVNRVTLSLTEMININLLIFHILQYHKI